MTTQIERARQEFMRFAREELEVRELGGVLYAFGSELAVLRVFAGYNANGAVHNAKVRVGYSENLGSHYFELER